MEQKTKKKKMNYPSFFKIMHGDFTTELRVPPAFDKYMRHKNVSREFTLSLKFGGEGSSWKVAVEKRRGDNSSSSCSYYYYFTRGWSEMAKDVQLEELNFLVFYLVANYAFQVAIFDRTGCAKTFTTPVITLDEEVEEEEEENGQKRNSVDVTLSSKRYKYYCCLPTKFARKTGLCKMEAVEIKDVAGRKWHIKLTSRLADYKVLDTEDNRRYEMRSGWKKFYQDNGLAVGDKLKLEHVQGCMMMLVKKTTSA